MPTRQQAEFERSLIEALRQKDISNAISELIITNISSKLSEKFEEYDNRISQLETEISNLKLKIDSSTPENDNIVSEHKKVAKKLESVQQHSKMNNIRLMGVKETDGENISDRVLAMFRDKLNINCDGQIQTIFRVGKKSGERPRHVIVAFKDIDSKINVYKRKSHFKGTPYVLKEDLTPERVKIVQDASTKYGFKNVWTFNGNIFAKTDNGVEKIFVSN